MAHVRSMGLSYKSIEYPSTSKNRALTPSGQGSVFSFCKLLSTESFLLFEIETPLTFPVVLTMSVACGAFLL